MINDKKDRSEHSKQYPCAYHVMIIVGDEDAVRYAIRNTKGTKRFSALKKMGAEVCVRLPDRIEEGYGISKKAIKEQAELGAKLFVTVDN